MTGFKPICVPLALAFALGASSSSVVFAQEGDETPPVDTETSAEAEETDKAVEEREDGKQKLSDRIKSVQRKDFIKKERIEIFPQFALDLNDPFFQHLIVGVAGSYHVADSFAVELRGGFVVASIEQSAIRFVRIETESLIEDPPEFKYHADIDALWAPFYGKISLFGEGILHFDTYVTAGGGAFGTDAGLNPSLNFGIGQRYFINDWLTARVEIRDYIFMDNRGNEADLQNLLVLGFSVSGFFPMSFEYEFQ
ncbi:MAG: outer membrane beta-barrel domain-containing protein [Deltaproteobacteria bacterium]|jgi:outer membrane beta-barrel protein